MSDDEDHQQAGSGASDTYPQQCSALRKNGYVMIKGELWTAIHSPMDSYTYDLTSGNEDIGSGVEELI